MRAASLFVVVFIVFLFCQIAFSQDAVTLYHEMQAATGSVGAKAAVRDFDECVRADTWDDGGKPLGEVWKRTRWLRPDSLRLDQVGPGDTYVLYFNGVSGWEVLPDGTFHELVGRELSFARNYLKGTQPEFDPEQDANDVFTSPAPDIIDISTKDNPSYRREIVLDPKTLLPTKSEQISLADPEHPVAKQTLEYEGWKAFEGVEFPLRTINFHYGKRLADIRLVRIKLNTGIRPEDLALKPQGLSPAMSACRETAAE
jgi:hypothetical protein